MGMRTMLPSGMAFKKIIKPHLKVLCQYCDETLTTLWVFGKKESCPQEFL